MEPSLGICGEECLATVRGQELRSGQKEPRLLSLIERSGEFILGVLATPDAVVSRPVAQLSIPINGNFEILREAEEALLIDFSVDSCVRIRIKGEKAPELLLELQDDDRTQTFFAQVKSAQQQVKSKPTKPKVMEPLAPSAQRGPVPIPPQRATKTTNAGSGVNLPKPTGALPPNLNNSTSTNQNNAGNIPIQYCVYSKEKNMHNDEDVSDTSSFRRLTQSYRTADIFSPSTLTVEMADREVEQTRDLPNGDIWPSRDSSPYAIHKIKTYNN